MGFFHLRSLPGMMWPPVPVLELSQLWTAYLELDRTQWLSPKELAARQLEQVRALLLHCFHQVPYYRGLLAQAGIGARPIQSLDDFRRLPLLSRELYQTNFANLQARNLPGGVVQTGVSHSSGTNGVPLKVLATNQSDLWWTAFFLRDLEWIGFDPRKRLAAIRLVAKSREELTVYSEGEAYNFWTKGLVPLLEMGSSYMMDIRQDPNRQLQWLRRIDVDYLLSFPSNLEFLAGLIAESGQRLPNLKSIQAIGETLPAAVRQRIEAGFGVPVQNTYSTTEAGYIASPCPLGHGLHVHAENVLAEVLDADDRPCLPGQTGRLVLTTLHNFLTPFLRYDILDDVTLARGPCPCGRGLPLWTAVEGRRHPLLHLPNGRRKAVSGLYLELRQVGGCRQFQIRQRAVEHIVLRIVPDKTWTPDHAARMRRAVQDEFEAPIRVDVEEYERLELPAGGKLKITVIEMDDEART